MTGHEGRCSWPRCRQAAEVTYHRRWGLCSRHLAESTANLHARVVRRPVEGCACEHCTGGDA